MPIMMYKQLVELLTPILMYGYFLESHRSFSCYNDDGTERDPDGCELIRALKIVNRAAWTETLLAHIHGPNKLQDRVAQYVNDVYWKAMSGVFKGESGPKSALALHLFVQHLLDTDYLVLHQGSKFHLVITRMTKMYEVAAEEDKVYNSAQKKAQKILQRWQGLGYFTDVPPLRKNEDAPKS